MNRTLIAMGGTAIAAFFFSLSLPDAIAQSVYNPLVIPESAKSPVLEPIDLTIGDSKHKRQIPIRVYLPPDKTPSPVVLFSHGLGGSREGSGYLGRHWAGRGYTVIFLQHPGSDAAVWRDAPMRRRMQSLKSAANVQNFKSRVDDVHMVLDRLEVLNTDSESPLSGRLDMKRVGMSGHSLDRKSVV